MARSLRDRATEITESDLVDFFPRDVRVVREGGGRALVGEMVLELGQANELGRLRYRLGASGTFQEARWSENPTGAARAVGKGRRAYAFRIPLEGATDSVQLEVEQLDGALTKRTFTWVAGEATAQ